ncbi:hypothetical protein A7K91_25750 [Paenibacillus oryzae]|uniref:Aminoglycoside phosphotransferase domain-containing protein n=1 Tax=Paenibacillus oryzae TaxID=1844972 RepID=A0A1A5YTD3_9BACL|nr:hypothetical protein A7K91_25750 [Paenibacillus oryzae]
MEVIHLKTKHWIGPDLLQNALKHYCASDPHLSYVGGLQNHVYEYKQGGGSFMLRLTPATNRTESLVQAELEWIIFLADKGVSVSKPIHSRNGRLTEAVFSPEQYFICAVFEKANGKAAEYPECLQDNDLYERLGRLTGKMHALSTSYQPQKDPRQDWSKNWFLQHIDLIPSSQAAVRASCSNLIKAVSSLPKEEGAYGLIHGDINVGNFRINEYGEITLFDFDEAQYSWFVEDIAVQLYYLVYVYGGKDGKELREEQARRFMKHFMKGYHLEHSLEEYWLKQIPLFLKLRELIVYIGAFRNWDGDEAFSGSDNQWFKDWIAESKARIENNIAIVDIWS